MLTKLPSWLAMAILVLAPIAFVWAQEEDLREESRTSVGVRSLLQERLRPQSTDFRVASDERDRKQEVVLDWALDSAQVPLDQVVVELDTGDEIEFARISEQLRDAGAETYQFSPELRLFRASALNRQGLEVLLRNEHVRYVEEESEKAVEPVYELFNVDAQDTHQVQELRDHHHLTGEGVRVGVWDQGAVLAQHVEFGSRVRVMDGADPPRDHATHVAGTIGAYGVPPYGTNAQGMAPSIQIASWDWRADVEELALASGQGIVVSNHSYGHLRGWSRDPYYGWVWFGDPTVAACLECQREDYLFGKYNVTSRSFDRVAFENPELSVVFAAGNDRGLRGNDPSADSTFDGTHYVAGTKTYSSEPRYGDGHEAGGFDTISGAALAKNVVTVGAIEDIVGPAATGDLVRVTGFSAWGPSDDGRIKPDVVANGADLYSPVATPRPDGSGYYTDRYLTKPGTSMAAPTVAGIAGLLAELSVRERQRPLYSDVFKAVLVHSAVSPYEGPSYQIGWGSVRADTAGDLIAGEVGQVVRESLTEGIFERKAVADGREEIRVTLVWLDPAAEPNSGSLDDRRKDLVNDLDLTVCDPSGACFFPWSLDPSEPTRTATRLGPNHTDNVERIDISDVGDLTGAWTIRIVAGVSAMNQTFSLAVWGLRLLP